MKVTPVVTPPYFAGLDFGVDARTFEIQAAIVASQIIDVRERFQGRFWVRYRSIRRRRSKGWRRHVRRLKAAKGAA